MMPEQTILVKMAEISVVENTPDSAYKLKTTLGSCVGVILSDGKRGVHGLAHILLPERLGGDRVIGKYADTAIPALLEKMEEKGCRKKDLSAFLVGGACMFEAFDGNGLTNIGDKNVMAATRILQQLRIPVVFQETGGKSGRTITFDGNAGKVFVKTLSKIETRGEKN